jgi:hypothetical protein
MTAVIIGDFIDRRVAQMDAEARAREYRKKQQDIADSMRPRKPKVAKKED